MQLRLADIDIQAISVGGLETCIEVASWKLCFDIGRCPPWARRVKRVLCTHAHMDHMGGIQVHAAQRDLMGMKPPEYVVPAEYLERFEAMMKAWQALSGSPLPHRLIAAEPGVEIPLGSARYARPFRSIHRAPCLGYALVNRREKLKAEFVGTPGREIGALRKRGVEVSEPNEVVEVAFCGDTTIQVLDQPDVRAARLLILECTFVGDRVTPERAIRTGHVHLDQIVERADELTNDAILLTHFSSRYSADYINRQLDERLPAGLRERVTALI
jgi:ribonuclease Z